MPFFRRILAVAVLTTVAGCFQQKAPTRPVSSTSAEGTNQAAAVEFLDLHDQAGAVLPSDLTPFTALRRISLRNTGLTNTPAALSTRSDLVWLDLSENPLPIFPDPEWIPNVETLYLADTAIAEIPASIGRLTKLSYLNMDRAPLVRLPEEIGQLNELQFIRLNNTRLTAIPDSMANLKKLKRLYARGTSLPPEEREKLTRLLPGTEIILD